MPGRQSPEWELFADWSGTLADLAGAANLLGWDRETLMPQAGAEGSLTRRACVHSVDEEREPDRAAFLRLREGGKTARMRVCG